MFQSSFGDNKLLYGAEMDGVLSKELLKEPINFEDVQFVELKTNQIKENDYHETMFKKNKLLKWWSQSYLVGIKKVLCGFRTYNGVVKHLEYFKVKDMPYKSKVILYIYIFHYHDINRFQKIPFLIEFQ